MISVSKKLRTAYYECLSAVTYNAVAVPVVDGFSLAETLSTHHIIIQDIMETGEGTMDSFRTKAIVTLQIVSYPDGYTKDVVDDIENTILTLLIPTPSTNGLTVTGVQVNDVTRDGSNYIDEYGESGPIIRKVVRISQTITEQ